MPIQGNAVVHTAVAGGGHPEKPASPLIDHQRPCTAFRHEPDDTAVDAAACFIRLIETFIVRTFSAEFKIVHGRFIVHRHRREPLRGAGENQFNVRAKTFRLSHPPIRAGSISSGPGVHRIHWQHRIRL